MYVIYVERGIAGKNSFGIFVNGQTGLSSDSLTMFGMNAATGSCEGVLINIYIYLSAILYMSRGYLM